MKVIRKMSLVNIGPETETIEYKKSTGEMKEAMISIAAILNKHKKGVLYFGVKNDGTVIGQVITDESLRKVSQAIGNHITPAIYPEIKAVRIGERECIQVDFEGNRQPYLAYSIPRIRVADEDLIMEQDIYDEMIRKRDNVKYSWERQVSEYTLQDIDKNAFDTYLQKAKDAGRISFEETDVKTVLNKLELIQGDHLLNAGAALFCNCGINELQMAKFATNERLTFTDIRRFTGSIIELSKKAEQYIIDAMDWRVEIGSGLSRKEIPEIPLDAIREAIINSFGHKIFDSGQSNEVAIFKDRIEIYNPGAFPTGVSPEKFIEGNERPVRRNPLITRTLYYSKDMESFATGLKRIYTACKAAGCRVEFEQQAYGFAVIFYRRNTSTQDSPQDSTQDKHQDNTQDSLQNRILEYCKMPRSKKEITVYMGYKDVKSFAKRYLKPLCEAGELQMTIPDRPSSRNQKYVTVEKKEEK